MLAILGPAGADALAQGDARALSVTPTFSATQTWTDNRNLSATDRESDFVTRLSPGVRVLSRSGAITGALDYQLNGVMHRRFSELNQTQHTFNSALLVRPEDDRFTVAMRGSLSRQTISAFGVQSADPLLETRNTTQVGNASIVPRLSGTLGGMVDYRVQVSRDITRAKDTQAGDSDSTAAEASLGGRSGRLGWGLDVNRQRVSFRTQSRSTDERAFASALWYPDGDLRLTLRAGRDRSDALGGGLQGRTTFGGGLAWTPSARTSLSLDVDRRFFGNSHALAFEYRTARSFWRVGDARSASNSSSTGVVSLTCEDLVRRIRGTAFQPSDVQQFCGFIGGDTVVATQKFLLTTRALTRTTDVAAAYLGLRTSVTLGAFRNQADSLQSTDLFGDFKTPSARSYGMTLAANHRLTPRDALSMVASWQRTPDAGGAEGNVLKSLNILWSTQAARRTSVSFGARHVIFDGIESYDETGLSASLSLQF